MQQTVELPQVQHTDEIADVTAVMRHQVPRQVRRNDHRTAEVGAPEIVDIPVPQVMLEQVAEVIQVIPQEPVSERTVEQTVDVPLH